jgi:pyruvate,water dikinase
MAIADPPASAPTLDIPEGFWQREDSHNPRPLTPLGSSIFVDGLNRSFPKVFAAFGLILETLAFREIGGYVYNSAVPLGAQAGDKPRGLPPAPLLWLALRAVPMFRKRLSDCKRAMRSRADRKLVDRWFDEWRPRLIADIARLRAVDLSSMTDDRLSEHVAEIRDWTWDAFDVHFYLTAPYGFALAKLSFFCRDYLGYDDLQVTRLLSGLSEASSEPAIALASLADRIRNDSKLRDAVIAAQPRDVPGIVRGRGGEIAAAYDDYVHRYAFRALRYEVVEKTMDEDPELVARLLQDQLRHPADVRTEQGQLARERAEAKVAALAALPDDAAKARFEDLLAEASRVYPTREDNEFFTVSVPLALVRRAALEAGRRLAKRNVIAAESDVFFLRVDEIAEALVRTPADGALAQRAGERRAALEAAERFSPPASYGVEPPLPPFWVLPPEARESMEAMQFAREKVFQLETADEKRDTSDERVVQGIAAARGTYSGPVRVIMGEHEFDKIRSGDVLVCPITSPVWSVLFAKVGALVTDSGGILSHPAIIAREYGIPAVVATRTGTSRLRDDQRVTVDGNAGVVRVVD